MRAHSRKLIIVVLLVFGVLGISSCSTISYYSQSVGGHLSLMAAREPIKKIIANAATPEERRIVLQQILDIRAYASASLALPDNKSYTSFVEVDNDAVVWNVVATPKLSIKPKIWCFPVAGCVSYRGYYAKSAAEKYAEGLNQDGEDYDVAVAGASAYSTLGWFNDPVYSSMLGRGEILLAEVIFHELAHQVLYVKKDSAFNEAFATTVATFGVRQWLADTDPEQLPLYEAHLQRRLGFNELIDATSKDLNTIYISNHTDSEKVALKAARFAQLKTNYEGLKASWDAYSGYDQWFNRSLNNAHLALVSTYWKKVPDFERWMIACELDFPRFYQAMEDRASNNKNANIDWLSAAADC